VWTNFRFGTAEGFEARQVFEHSQFPVEHFDALVASQVSRRRANDEAEAKGLVGVLQMIGDCHIVAHSHGAALVMDALGNSALQPMMLEHVKSMVFIEPGPTSNARFLKGASRTLVIWGDNIEDEKIWPKIVALFEQSPAEIIHLPDRGIKGNSHFAMSEKNSDEVFALIADWLEQ
jgi:hypothetical protein